MEEERFEQLKKDVNRLNEEGFVPPDKELRVFRNAGDLITAIRNNEIPNIKWTPEDEAKWLAAEAIDSAFENQEYTGADQNVKEFSKDITWDEEELEALGEDYFQGFDKKE